MTIISYSVGILLLAGILLRAWQHLKYDCRRPMIRYAVKTHTYPMTIVEIGVYYGTNSRRMLRTLPVKKLYLVDPYNKYADYTEKRVILTLLPSSFKPVLWLLRKHRDKIVPLQLESEMAAEVIPDGLDMVYIDGNHSYEYVKKDIELYYSKLKKGGMIGGHDINGRTTGKDVQKAVAEFSSRYNIKINVEEPDWWAEKV